MIYYACTGHCKQFETFAALSRSAGTGPIETGIRHTRLNARNSLAGVKIKTRFARVDENTDTRINIL